MNPLESMSLSSDMPGAEDQVAFAVSVDIPGLEDIVHIVVDTAEPRDRCIQPVAVGRGRVDLFGGLGGPCGDGDR